ncbi:hypothetical protein BV20DRAFT_148531 [Pilatotrama ljubarskyi]|nr:hypothetical protein BV20DRAFT_148531 [Pilatotrama ljubarskyi]
MDLGSSSSTVCYRVGPRVAYGRASGPPQSLYPHSNPAFHLGPTWVCTHAYASIPHDHSMLRARDRDGRRRCAARSTAVVVSRHGLPNVLIGLYIFQSLALLHFVASAALAWFSGCQLFSTHHHGRRFAAPARTGASDAHLPHRRTRAVIRTAKCSTSSPYGAVEQRLARCTPPPFSAIQRSPVLYAPHPLTGSQAHGSRHTRGQTTLLHQVGYTGDRVLGGRIGHRRSARCAVLVSLVSRDDAGANGRKQRVARGQAALDAPSTSPPRSKYVASQDQVDGDRTRVRRKHLLRRAHGGRDREL